MSKDTIRDYWTGDSLHASYWADSPHLPRFKGRETVQQRQDSDPPVQGNACPVHQTQRDHRLTMKTNRNGKAAILTDEQFAALLEAASSPIHSTLWLLQRKTAARISEALQLRWCDVDGCITFRKETTKTKTTRQIPIDASLHSALADLRPADAVATDYIFHSATSRTQITRQAADKALRSTCARLGSRE